MRTRFALFGLALGLLAQPVAAQPVQAQPVAAPCRGQDLIAALMPEHLAPIRAAADAVPYGAGNFWRATKGTENLTLIGTLHLDDPRFDSIVESLDDLVAGADLLLVEAGPAEAAQLTARLAKDPSLLVNTDGPTLPEILTKDQWQALSAAMAARGVPGFMAAKFRPWYVSVLLSMPPCALGAGVPNGLDHRLMDLADAYGVPVAGLEPYDTAFKVFADGTRQQQLAMISAALTAEAHSEDLTTTLINGYFAQDAWMVWEFTKVWSQSLPGYDPVAGAAEIALIEDRLTAARNIAWIPVIEAALAAETGPVLVAFGALHLAGDQGVLNLLAQRGYDLQRIVLR